MVLPLTKQLHELSLTELSELLVDTSQQFIAALKNEAPIDDLQILRDYIIAIRKEIRRIEGRRE
jgi:hypothetical protein